MSGLGGQEVLAELDKRQISLPIALMSGYSETQLREFQTKSVVVSILHKPFPINDLLYSVKSAQLNQSIVN